MSVSVTNLTDLESRRQYYSEPSHGSVSVTNLMDSAEAYRVRAKQRKAPSSRMAGLIMMKDSSYSHSTSTNSTSSNSLNNLSRQPSRRSLGDKAESIRIMLKDSEAPPIKRITSQSSSMHLLMPRDDDPGLKRLRKTKSSASLSRANSHVLLRDDAKLKGGAKAKLLKGLKSVLRTSSKRSDRS